MEIIKESDFRKELKGTPRTGYLFFGEEDYLKAFALRQARDTLCPEPSYAFFNDIRLDAVDFEAQKLMDAIMPMPMMAERKLITLTGLNLNTLRQSDLDSLCGVLESLSEYDYNTVILVAAADCLNPGLLPKRPSALLSRLSETLTPVQFDRCTTAKLSAWVQKHFAHNGIEVSTDFCTRVPEYCGHSMFILANEIDKLSYYARFHGKTTVTEADLHTVCTPTDEYDAFAFTNAIMEGRRDAALAILSDYRFRRVDPLMILGDVTRVICDMVAVRAMATEGASGAEMASVLKLHEFKVGLYQKSLHNVSEERLYNALNACCDADKALKLSPQGYTPLETLICRL